MNFGGTVAVARAAKEAGVRRFVFASSCSMYGTAGSDDLLDEDAPQRPLTPYAESKVRAEEALFALGDDDFSVVSMRNATVYGASPRLRLDVVLNNLVAWAVTSGSIKLMSDGRSWRPLVHVKDLARVTNLLLGAPAREVANQAFNVGSSEQNYVVRDLASARRGRDLAATCTSRTAPPRIHGRYRVSFAKLESALPALDFAWDASRGIRELLDSYSANRLTAEVFDSRRFIRLRQLRHLIDGGALTADLHWRPQSAEIA